MCIVCVCVCVYEYVYVCVRMYVNLYVCMYACIYACVCVYKSERECICVSVRMRLCIHVCIYMCVYAYMCVYVCVYVWVHECVYVCVCICVCVLRVERGRSVAEYDTINFTSFFLFFPSPLSRNISNDLLAAIFEVELWEPHFSTIKSLPSFRQNNGVGLWRNTNGRYMQDKKKILSRTQYAHSYKGVATSLKRNTPHTRTNKKKIVLPQMRNLFSFLWFFDTPPPTSVISNRLNRNLKIPHLKFNLFLYWKRIINSSVT